MIATDEQIEAAADAMYRSDPERLNWTLMDFEDEADDVRAGFLCMARAGLEAVSEENPLDALLGEEFRINAAGKYKGECFAYVARHSIKRQEPSFRGNGATIDEALRNAVAKAIASTT